MTVPDTRPNTALAVVHGAARATALDAARIGFGTEVLQDAIAAVDLAEGDGDRATAAMAAAGCVLGYCYGMLP